jgi:hypothetical protein
MHRDPKDSRTLDEWADDQLKAGMEGNQACLQCHSSMAANIPSHTRHAQGSSGSLCYNCHMPYTTYGLLKAIRSHTVDSPTVAASLATGRPNACNLCHLDRTLAWTAGKLKEWYGTPEPALDEDQRSTAASILWMLTGDAGQRVLVAWSMGWQTSRAISGSGWLAPYLAALLEDPYDAVRYIAYRSLRRLEGFQNLAYDYMGSREAQDAAVSEVMTLWTARQARNPTTGENLLIDKEGEMLKQKFVRLSKSRDDRRVELQE